MSAMSSIVELTRVLEAVPEVRLAVLFGSSARGTGTSSSDLDVGVLLAEGSPRSSALAVALSRAAGRDVDLIVLNDAPPLLRFEIARDGRPLIDRTGESWADFRAHAMVDWWDWAPTARMLTAASIARLRRAQADGPA
jgi:hypothetical protein